MNRPIANYVLIGLFVVGIVYLVRSRPPAAPIEVKTVSLEAGPATPANETPCWGQDRCLFVYVAPWCPACKEAAPGIQALREDLKTSQIGFSIVVGSDKPERLQTMAQKLGPQTFLDPQGQFKAAAAVTAIPYWVLIDKSGKVLTTWSGAYEGPQAVLEYKKHLHL